MNQVRKILNRFIFQGNLSRRLYLAALIIIGIVATAQTYWLMPRHFTHIDDIGVAESLLIRNMDYQNDCDKNFSELRGKILLATMRSPERACSTIRKLNRLNIISGLWTYAPAQFWLTQALLDPQKKYSYEEVKYWGRLPSFLFYILGAVGFYFLAYFMMTENHNQSASVVALTLSILLILSLENRIFAAQMHSYAIGIIANVTVLYAYLRILFVAAKTYRSVLISCLLFSIAIAMQYQALLMVVAGFGAILICHVKITKGLSRKFILRFIFLVTTTAFISYCLVGNISELSSRGINWNVGPHGEFIVRGTSNIDRIGSFIALFMSQTPENLYAIVSGIQLPNAVAYIFGLLIFFVCLAGLIFLWKKRNHEINFAFLVFIFLYACIYGSLIFISKLSFSPTRHFLFFLPIVLILIGYGSNQLKKWAPASGLKFIVLVYSLVSVSLFPVFAKDRIDKLSTGIFAELAQQSDASFLLYGGIDIEPLFTESATQLPIFWYMPAELNCADKEILIPPNRVLRFMTYDKQVGGASNELQNLSYLQDLILNCTSHAVIDKKIVSIKYLGYVENSLSNTSNELSNRVIRGVHDNNSFIRLYEIKTNFDSNLYDASLEEGIDFRRAGYPAFLKFVAGISHRENWGRWTDVKKGKSVLLGFKSTLPKNLTLELEIQDFPKNTDKPTIIRVGKQEKSIVVSGDKKLYSLDFNNDENINLIEIIPPETAKKGKVENSVEDPRNIGIGLISLRVKTKSR